jgi:hypothetical protein
MGLADLSSVLWRERETLELLLFKLEEEYLVLAGNRTRWLSHATREVELVLEQIKRTEVVRAAEVDAVGLELGIGPNASLAQLVEAAPPPWNDLFAQHRRAFLTLSAEIQALAAANRERLTSGQRAVRETMLSVTDTVETYGRRGQTVASLGRINLVDEAI